MTFEEATDACLTSAETNKTSPNSAWSKLSYLQTPLNLV